MKFLDIDMVKILQRCTVYKIDLSTVIKCSPAQLQSIYSKNSNVSDKLDDVKTPSRVCLVRSTEN